MKKLIVFFIVIGVGVAAALVIRNRNKNGAGEAAGELQKVKAERGPIRLTVASTGRVVSNLDVEIKCKASGQIMKLPYDISDHVKPGDLLLELDPVDENRNVQSAEVRLAASKARLEQSRLNLETAEQNLANDENLASASLRAAEAAYKDAAAKAGRMRQLLESERVSKEECETAETAATRASVELESAKIRLDQLKVEREALEIRRQDIKLAETQRDSDQIALDMAKQRLSETKVYVPASTQTALATRPRVAYARPSSGAGVMRRGSDSPDGQGADLRPRMQAEGFDPAAFAMSGQRAMRGRGGRDSGPTGDTPATGSTMRQRGDAESPRSMGGERGSRGGSPDGVRRGGPPEGFDPSAFAMGGRGRGGRGARGGRGFARPAPIEDEPSTEPYWVVSTRDVQIGQIISSPMNNVSGGTALMTLSDLSRMFVIASVDESLIGRVELGQEVEITADAFPEMFFSGRVVRVATKGEAVSNVVTFEVKIEILGPGKEKLKPEMTANVEIIVAQNMDALLLPSEAVRSERGQKYVQLAAAEGAPGVKRDVVTGIDDGFQIEIVDGLQEGDEVLVPELGSQSRWSRGGMSDAMRQRMRSGMMMRMGGGRRR